MPVFIKPDNISKRDKGFKEWFNLDLFIKKIIASSPSVVKSLINTITGNDTTDNIIIENTVGKTIVYGFGMSSSKRQETFDSITGDPVTVDYNSYNTINGYFHQEMSRNNNTFKFSGSLLYFTNQATSYFTDGSFAAFIHSYIKNSKKFTSAISFEKYLETDAQNGMNGSVNRQYQFSKRLPGLYTIALLDDIIPTNLSYDASNRIINSTSGDDATLPIADGTIYGLSLNDFSNYYKTYIDNLNEKSATDLLDFLLLYVDAMDKSNALTSHSPFATISDLQPTGLITITDLQGQAFTDLASAMGWFAGYCGSTPTDTSLNAGVFKFTVPANSVIFDNFCFNNNILFEDPIGLIIEFGNNCFSYNNQNNIIGVAIFGDYCFQNASPKIKNTIKQIVNCGSGLANGYAGRMDIQYPSGNLPGDVFTTTSLAWINVPYLYKSNPTQFLIAAKANMTNPDSAINYEGVDNFSAGFVYKGVDFTAENGGRYAVDGTTITDPTPITGQGYEICVVGNGLFIDGITYLKFSLIHRFYDREGYWTTKLINKQTNLQYFPSATAGEILNDNGISANIPLADSTNSGLMSPSQVEAINNKVDKGADNSTTIVLTSAQLNSQYPTAGTGFEVYCASIIAGSMMYKKRVNGWFGITTFIP